MVKAESLAHALRTNHARAFTSFRERKIKQKKSASARRFFYLSLRWIVSSISIVSTSRPGTRTLGIAAGNGHEHIHPIHPPRRTRMGVIQPGRGTWVMKTASRWCSARRLAIERIPGLSWTQAGIEFNPGFVPPTAHTGTGRVAALGHKVRDHR
jgi:hypothetical protein